LEEHRGPNPQTHPGKPGKNPRLAEASREPGRALHETLIEEGQEHFLFPIKKREPF
jgi:hypothetical protein